MKTKLKTIVLLSMIFVMIFVIGSLAITEIDNGIMKIYPSSGGYEMEGLKGFDIKGYITTDESTNEKKLFSTTFSDSGYHTFLNVNGLSGEMDDVLTYVEDGRTWQEKVKSMQYTEVNGDGWQKINGIDMKVSTQFINNGKQLQIIYDLKNTTSSSATISLATVADVQIDHDDEATIERLKDGSGVKLWTKKGETGKPVQFVFYGKDIPGTTAVDNIWIGYWITGDYIRNMFIDNSDVEKIENSDSAFSYSWVNRIINAGATQKYTVLMEVGGINVPSIGITLDNNKKFYYKDVKINGTVTDEDLRDKVTVHYVVDGTEYTLPTMYTNGTTKNFTLDLTSLNLSPVTPHTLKVWATDSTGCKSNVEERAFTIVGIDTKIDSQGPDINFSRANGKTEINVTDTGTGIKSTQYAWTTENTEPTKWENYSSAVTYSGSSMGKLYLWAKSTDNADNTTTASSIFSALEKPSIVSEDEFKNKNISFKVTSETEDTDVLYQFKINKGEWQSITKDSNHKITDITKGTVSVSARILDNAGRYSKIASKTVKVSIIEKPKDETPTSSEGIDKTTTVGKLPHTGEGPFIIMIVVVVALVGISFFFYKKIVFYKDIK